MSFSLTMISLITMLMSNVSFREMEVPMLTWWWILSETTSMSPISPLSSPMITTLISVRQTFNIWISQVEGNRTATDRVITTRIRRLMRYTYLPKIAAIMVTSKPRSSSIGQWISLQVPAIFRLHRGLIQILTLIRIWTIARAPIHRNRSAGSIRTSLSMDQALSQASAIQFRRIYLPVSRLIQQIWWILWLEEVLYSRMLQVKSVVVPRQVSEINYWHPFTMMMQAA